MSVPPLDQLRRRLPVINGSHPDGAIGLAANALAAPTSGRARHLEQHTVGGHANHRPPGIPLDEQWEPENSMPVRRR